MHLSYLDVNKFTYELLHEDNPNEFAAHLFEYNFHLRNDHSYDSKLFYLFRLSRTTPTNINHSYVSA